MAPLPGDPSWPVGHSLQDELGRQVFKGEPSSHLTRTGGTATGRGKPPVTDSGMHDHSADVGSREPTETGDKAITCRVGIRRALRDPGRLGHMNSGCFSGHPTSPHSLPCNEPPRPQHRSLRPPSWPPGQTTRPPGRPAQPGLTRMRRCLLIPVCILNKLSPPGKGAKVCSCCEMSFPSLPCT